MSNTNLIEKLKSMGFEVKLSNDDFDPGAYDVKIGKITDRHARAKWFLQHLIERYENGKLQTSERQMKFLMGLLDKVRRINDGNDDEVTVVESERLEELFITTSDDFVLTKEKEDSLINQLLEQAKSDYKNDRFSTLSDALIHYNLHSLLHKVEMIEGEI